MVIGRDGSRSPIGIPSSLRVNNIYIYIYMIYEYLIFTLLKKFFFFFFIFNNNILIIYSYINSKVYYQMI
ncbi:hypothetical protein H8356DRAFT_1737584, partial [Neocallimastix lanati (nom. inval.)]